MELKNAISLSNETKEKLKMIEQEQQFQNSVY